MATVDTFSSIVTNVHTALKHQGETKAHKQIQLTCSNTPMSVVKEVVSKCVRCAEKAKKKCVRGVVVRPISVSELNDSGQVDLIDSKTLPDE